MIISLLAAVDEAGGIGKDNRIPWRLTADLRRFKRLTMGHHLIMGRKTYESIGRALPGRTLVVLTRNPAYRPSGPSSEGVLLAPSLPAALDLAAERGEVEAFVIGGGEIFARALALADRIYLTTVHTRVASDVFFPQITPQDWVILETIHREADAQNEWPSTYQILERKQLL